MTTNEISTEQIWAYYQSRLRAFLISRISNPDDTEDLLQDILLKVHRNLSSLKSNDRLKPWLFQIAQNTIVDFYRAKQKNSTIHPDDLWWVNNEPNVEHELEQCVSPFIDALSPKYSKLLSAIELEGQSQKDYADKHNIAYSTLKSRVQKGRDLLRSSFENCCSISLDSRGNIAQVQPKSDSCKHC